jgi:hypothetical protein
MAGAGGADREEAPGSAARLAGSATPTGKEAVTNGVAGKVTEETKADGGGVPDGDVAKRREEKAEKAKEQEQGQHNGGTEARRQ